MKRYLVKVAWNKDFKKYGFDGGYRHYFETVENAEKFIKEKEMDSFCINQRWQISDITDGKIIKEGHTQLSAYQYGF